MFYCSLHIFLFKSIPGLLRTIIFLFAFNFNSIAQSSENTTDFHLASVQALLSLHHTNRLLICAFVSLGFLAANLPNRVERRKERFTELIGTVFCKSHSSQTILAVNHGFLSEHNLTNRSSLAVNMRFLPERCLLVNAPTFFHFLIAL